MSRVNGVCVWAIVAAFGFAQPVLAQTPAPRPLAATAALADRIQNAIDRYQSAGARPTLDELKALTIEAATAKTLDPMLAADLATIYAYSLARNKQPDDAITIIQDAQSALTAAGKGNDVKMGDLMLAEAAFEDLKGDTDTAPGDQDARPRRSISPPKVHKAPTPRPSRRRSASACSPAAS